MAGGKGSRLGTQYKPFIEVCGKPMILWVYDTVRSLVNEDEIYVSTIENHPILPLLEKVINVKNIVFTSGKGYEYDILESIQKVGLPTIVLPSDTPFVASDDILTLINYCKSSICNLVYNGKFVGISYWNSLNLDDYCNIESREEIINVNTIDDLEYVENKCKEGAF